MQPRRPASRTLAVAAFGSLALACSARSASDVAPAPNAPAPPVVLPAPAPPLPAPYATLGSAPPDGPPNEYDAMMELMRASLSRPNDPIETTMLSFQRIGDWARVGTQSHVPGRRDDSEAMHAYSSLFRKVDGAWQLIETNCAEDSEACDESRTLASFTKRVPGVPQELAPHPPATKVKPTIYGRFGETTLAMAFEDLPKLVPLAKGETFKMAEIARDGTSSYHVVAMLDAETLHKHVNHDLMVVLIEGQGEMRIGSGHPSIIGPRSIVHVPRGIVHAMRNTEKTPLIGYVVFTPPFDGKDRVAVDL